MAYKKYVFPDEDDEDVTELPTYWISDLSIMNGLLIMKVAANPQEKELRRANVILSFVDGWRKKTSVKLMITQANANNEFGTEIPFDGVRDFLGKITKDIYYRRCSHQ